VRFKFFNDIIRSGQIGRMYMKRAQLGFTLMELMVTIAIIGILASIAIPSYQDSVKKSRRADVKAVLLGLANAMERHFTEKNTYCHVATGGATVAACGAAGNDTGTPDAGVLGFTIPNATTTFYTVTISAVAPSSYTLQAVPAGAQTGDKCGNFILEHTGEKKVANSTSTPATDCW
jgi:type IV pilus assembly protein PilE